MIETWFLTFTPSSFLFLKVQKEVYEDIIDLENKLLYNECIIFCIRSILYYTGSGLPVSVRFRFLVP